MSNQAVLSNYTDAIAALPQEAFLGSLVYFTITNADVNLTEAYKDVEALGLPTLRLPDVLRPVDAFSKAAKEFAHKFRPIDGVRSEIMVRPVGADGEQVHRHIILERAVIERGKKRRIAYEKVGELIFTRGTKKKGIYEGFGVVARETTEFLQRELTEDERGWITSRIETFQSRFDHLLNYMDSHAVRTFVRETVYDLSGVCVRQSGGLYFVRQNHADKVAALKGWTESIHSEFHSLPLLNLGEQRDMILSAFEDEAVAEVERLMGEVNKILADPNRTIEAKTFDAYGLRAAELSSKVNEYNSMLGARADRASIEIDMYTQQVLTLSGRIRETGQKVTVSK